jgi:hypothetical protein
MYYFRIILLSIVSLSLLSCSDNRPWQNFNDNGVDELAANFQSPPVEYSMTFYWGWDGNITEEVIVRDLDAFKERGVHIVTLEPGYDMGNPYLSPEWLEMVKRTVDLARERDMRVWIVDEGKYPSGFAGGKFTTDAPELRMKALVVADELEVTGGKSISQKLPDDVVSAIAINQADTTNQILDCQSGKLNWTAPEGTWNVMLIKHDFRSSPTRAVNNPTRGKDPSNSLCDYLDPAATFKFLEFTHEEHKKRLGAEFGKTVLGFRGDEPDYSIRGIPWTPKIFEIFKQRKGYDVQPYTASFFTSKPTDEQKRVKADYWEIWSDLFGKYFFQQQADWCAQNNLEYLVHLNKEDDMIQLVAHEGDFFECMRHVQMPGVDAIWNQIWPEDGKVTDYPKYASSVAHVYGKPRSFTESFAAYRTKPTVAQAKWVLDQQLVRGINMVEVMFVPASTRGKLGLRGWNASDEFPDVAKYVHRACYLLSQGRPVADIAVYHPTSSLWLGHNESNEYVLKLMKQLLEMQRDFDFVDETALSSAMQLENDIFKNLSGQTYRTVLIPSAYSISKQVLNRLKSFAASGGNVIFLVVTPSLVVDKTFRDATAPEDLSWAIIEPSGKLTADIINALPEADVKLDSACFEIKYVHRKLADADLYFFFNESTEQKIRDVTIAGKGQAQHWNAMSGEIQNVDATALDNGRINFTLNLEPYQTKFIIIGK